MIFTTSLYSLSIVLSNQDFIGTLCATRFYTSKTHPKSGEKLRDSSTLSLCMCGARALAQNGLCYVLCKGFGHVFPHSGSGPGNISCDRGVSQLECKQAVLGSCGPSNPENIIKTPEESSHETKAPK